MCKRESIPKSHIRVSFLISFAFVWYGCPGISSLMINVSSCRSIVFLSLSSCGCIALASIIVRLSLTLNGRNNSDNRVALLFCIWFNTSWPSILSKELRIWFTSLSLNIRSFSINDSLERSSRPFFIFSVNASGAHSRESNFSDVIADYSLGYSSFIIRPLKVSLNSYSVLKKEVEKTNK